MSTRSLTAKITGLSYVRITTTLFSLMIPTFFAGLITLVIIYARANDLTLPIPIWPLTFKQLWEVLVISWLIGIISVQAGLSIREHWRGIRHITEFFFRNDTSTGLLIVGTALAQLLLAFGILPNKALTLAIEVCLLVLIPILAAGATESLNAGDPSHEYHWHAGVCFGLFAFLAQFLTGFALCIIIKL